MTQQEDRNFMNMLVFLIGGLLVFFVLIIIIARSVTGSDGANTDPMVEAATIERIQPYGKVNIGSAPAVVSASAVNGKDIYTSSCFACHGTGAAGAPKLGDKAAWAKRISQGMDTLFDHALTGFKGMPARGGNASLSSDAVKAAVKYIVAGSK